MTHEEMIKALAEIRDQMIRDQAAGPAQSSPPVAQLQVMERDQVIDHLVQIDVIQEYARKVMAQRDAVANLLVMQLEDRGLTILRTH